MSPGALGLAFGGFRGAGKTTLSKLASARFDFPRVSFGDEVRRIAQARGLEGTVAELQDIGTEQVEREPVEFCKRVLEQAPSWRPGCGIIVDGVRHTAILLALRALVSPTRLVMVYLDPPDDVRMARLSERNDAIGRLFTNHPNEDDLRNLRASADVIVDDSDNLDRVVSYLDQGPE